MAITLAGSGEQAGASAANGGFVTAVSLGHTPAVGNLVVFVLNIAAAKTVTAPAGWTLDRSVDGAAAAWTTRVYSRVIDGTEAASYGWTWSGAAFRSTACWEFAPSVAGSNWVVDTGGSDTGTASSVTSRAMGTSATLGSADSAAAGWFSHNSGTSTSPGITGGGTWSIIAAGAKFSQYGSVITTANTALSPTATWTTSRDVATSGFQTYYATAPGPVPDVVPLTFTVDAPTITADGSATPAAVPLTLTLPAPSISLGAGADPAAVPLTLTVPAPTILTGTEPTPGPVTLTFTVPAPTIHYDTQVTPAAVALGFTVPAPTLGFSQQVHPSPVPLAFDIPVPRIITVSTPPAFDLGRPPTTGPAERYPNPPYDPTRGLGYRDGGVPYDP